VTRSHVLAALFALSCSDGPVPAAPPKSYAPLVALDDWRGVERDADPFVADPEAVASCASPGFRVEEEQAWLELDTSSCAWVTVTAPALFAVEVGQALRIELSHFDLEAPEPAEAEVRLWFDDCEAWSESIPIPSAAEVSEEELASPCALKAGGDVYFHLRNHGQNTYQLQGIAVLR